MAGLRAYQEDLKRLIFPGPSQTTTSALWGTARPDRLEVYRNTTRTTWTETLDCDFSLTRTQFAPADWQALQRHYFVKHPPRHWELNGSMEPFVKFLCRQKVRSYVKELADYEWHDLKIFIDRSEVRTGAGLTNPTAVVRVYQHQIFNWVEKKAPRDQPPRQKPEVLVFFRDSKNTCHIREAEPLMLLAMDHFRTPAVRLQDLESARRKLLPKNKVPLETVIRNLKQLELLL